MTRGLGTAGLTAGCLILGAGRAQAQVSASLDLASGNATYDGGTATTIVSFSPSLAVQAHRWSAGASGTYTSFNRGGWSGQGSVAGSWFTPALGPFVAEVSARGDHSARAFGLGTGQALGQVRGHLFAAGRGFWIGAARGRAWHGGGDEEVARVEGGFWLRVRNARATLAMTRGSGHDTLTLGPAGGGGLVAAYDLRVPAPYAEAAMALEWAEGPFEMSGMVARRSTSREAGVMSWQVAATYWFTENLGFIIGGGRYSPDLWQAHPGGQYATVAVRVGYQPAVRSRLRTPSTRPVPGIAGFEIGDIGEGQWLLRVDAPLAQLVEVMGDFTDWQPLRLLPSGDGAWTAVLPLAPGTYRLNIRVDGGTWGVPPGVGAAMDEFSGRVGVLIVSRS